MSPENPRFCVYDLLPHEYMGCVETINDKYHEYFQSCFDSLYLHPTQAVLVVGSDGKKERHAQSQPEFVFLTTPRYRHMRFPQQIQNIISQIRDLSHPTLDTGQEIRVVGAETLSFYDNDPKKAYPDRIFNSSLIKGDPDTYLNARIQILKEMTAQDPLGNRIRNKINEQLKAHKKAIRTGMWRGLPIFNAGASEQYYHELPDVLGAFGFKHSFIRASQRTFDLITIKLIQFGNMSISEAAQNIPSNTYKKFDFFTNFLPQSASLFAEAQTAYSWFLREYHRIQEAFKNTRQNVAFPFNAEEFKFYSNIIWNFINTQLI